MQRAQLRKPAYETPKASCENESCGTRKALLVAWEHIDSQDSAESLAIAFELLLGPGPHELDATDKGDKVVGI